MISPRQAPHTGQREEHDAHEETEKGSVAVEEPRATPTSPSSLSEVALPPPPPALVADVPLEQLDPVLPPPPGPLPSASPKPRLSIGSVASAVQSFTAKIDAHSNGQTPPTRPVRTNQPKSSSSPASPSTSFSALPALPALPQTPQHQSPSHSSAPPHHAISASQRATGSPPSGVVAPKHAAQTTKQQHVEPQRLNASSPTRQVSFIVPDGQQPKLRPGAQQRPTQ